METSTLVISPQDSARYWSMQPHCLEETPRPWVGLTSSVESSVFKHVYFEGINICALIKHVPRTFIPTNFIWHACMAPVIPRKPSNSLFAKVYTLEIYMLYGSQSYGTQPSLYELTFVMNSPSCPPPPQDYPPRPLQLMIATCTGVEGLEYMRY